MDAQENQIFIAIVIAIVVIGAVIGYFIISSLKHQRKVLQLERENAHAEITALERDRERISNDIHDDLSPMLVGVKMIVNSFDFINIHDHQLLEKANGTLDEMANRMRAISFDLMPASLKNKGVFVALKDFVNTVNETSNLKVKLWLSDAPPKLADHQTLHIYRIVKEIIHNTVKHARAAELVVALKNEGSELQIVTQDNGIGFNLAEKLGENAGFGLRSLQNRVSLISGTLRMESETGKGTSYLIQIPLHND